MTQTPDDAEILSRDSKEISRWVRLEEVTVRMPGVAGAEIYHGVRVADSVSVLAMTPDGRFPIVQQFRPLIGAPTWELPSGFRDAGESGETAGVRELKEETGFGAARVVRLVEIFELPARLTSRLSLLFVLASGTLGEAEPGMRLSLVDGAELKRLAGAGAVAHPASMACLYAAAANAEVRAICAEHGFAAPPWL